VLARTMKTEKRSASRFRIIIPPRQSMVLPYIEACVGCQGNNHLRILF
jgi:hypothetical protein